MSWVKLNLWADEEERIQECITNALCLLIQSKKTLITDDELVISGRLRPYLFDAKKKLKLSSCTLHPEVSCFRKDDDPRPSGHPDIQFSFNTPDGDQYNYDVECKLVRIKRDKKIWDYCEHYVTEGIMRFQSRKYAQSFPPMGTMIGYVQECNEIFEMLEEVNKHNVNEGLQEIQNKSLLKDGEVSHLVQKLNREKEKFILHHKWADLR